jgi:hypothetical protein
VILHPAIVAPHPIHPLQSRNSHKKVAEEIWLLIFADRTHPSQMFFVAPDFPLDSVSSRFTRTFYCGYPVTEGVIDLTKKFETTAVIF